MTRHRPTVHEFVTRTRRHLVLYGVNHTACGRGLGAMVNMGRVTFPWHAPHCCKICERVLASGGLGFYVTALGNILTDEDIEYLSQEAEGGYNVERLMPVQRPGPEPGVDAMHWYPKD